MNTIIQQWNNQEKTEKLGVSPEDIKPNAAVLGYGAVKNSMSAERECYVPPRFGDIAREKPPQLKLVDYSEPHTHSAAKYYADERSWNWEGKSGS
ncbi:hypothetical protein ACXM0N_20945 [Peribacillus simplex]